MRETFIRHIYKTKIRCSYIYKNNKKVKAVTRKMYWHLSLKNMAPEPILTNTGKYEFKK